MGTLFFAFISVGGPDYGTFVIHNNDSLHILVGLHTIQSFLYFWHLSDKIINKMILNNSHLLHQYI